MSRNFREFFPGERKALALTKAFAGIFATTLPPAIQRSKDFLRLHAGTVATFGNILETAGSLVTGLSDDPRFFIPGALATGIGKSFRQLGTRQQTISFRDMPHKRRRNGSSRRFNNFGISPRRRRTQLLKRKASNLMRIERLEREITRIPKKEIKVHDFTEDNFNVPQFGTGINGTLLTRIAQGVELTERIGEKIEAVRLLWNINIRHNFDDVAGPVTQRDTVRLVIVVDSEQLDSSALQSQVLFQDTTSGRALTFYNDKFPQRFLILVDRTYDATWHTESYNKTDTGSINLSGMDIRFTGGLESNVGKNAISVFIVSTSGDFASADGESKVKFKSRLEYTG